MPNESKPKQNIMLAVDIVLLDDNAKRILLINRKDNDRFAMVGGMVEDGETLVEAAVRELHEETGIHVYRDQLRYVGYADAVHRDPRQRVISHVFCAKVNSEDHGYRYPEAGDDAKTAEWYDVEWFLNESTMYPHKFAFDHIDIIEGVMVRSTHAI